MKKLLIILSSVTLVFLASTVSSGSMIDFTDSSLPWNSANNLQSFDYTYVSGDLSGLKVTLEARPIGASLWQDDTDGIGIRNHWEDDEIEWNEQLRILFSSTIKVNTISFADLFKEWGYTEKGLYSYDEGVSWITFDAEEFIGGGSNGERIVDVGVNTASLWFTGDTSADAWGRYEYAVQKIDVELVPEASTLMMLGASLIGVAFYSRRRK